MMNAFEMLRYFWNATKGKAGVRKEQFQFDQGSVEDQLWEEQAFYQSVEGVWVSLHQAELYHPDFYEWETIEFLVGGEVRYSSGLDKVEDIKVEPGDVEMIVERRKEYHLDPAVIFVDPPDEVEWRWVVREHSDVENQVEVCYQQRSDSRSPWTTPEPLAQGLSHTFWPKVKDVVASFWSLANKGWEIEELSYQVRLFEYGPECCLRVYNDYDCPEYLRFDYQEWHEPSQAYITKGGELGLLKKDQWDLIEAAIEKYFKEHLS